MLRKLLFLFILFFALTTVKATAAELPLKPTTDTLSIIGHIENWYKLHTNYFSITAMMACESSIIPIPSEMVIPPAVFIALEPDSQLNIILIVLFGTLGALIGASFNYFMSMWLGRYVVYKFADSRAGKLFLLSSAKIQKAEGFFNEHGKTSTFVGRFIPVVRHLISIPAGLAKMNYFHFALYTTLGAGLWNVCLALTGYLAHGQQEIINRYSGEISILFVVGGIILMAFFVYKTMHKIKKKA